MYEERINQLRKIGTKNSVSLAKREICKKAACVIELLEIEIERVSRKEALGGEGK